VTEKKIDIAFAAVAGTVALAAILAMPTLVASPKLLFGRSLSAIAPSLFPYITLSLIVLLSASLILISITRVKSALSSNASDSNGKNEEAVWPKKAAFFPLLVGYGFLLKPLGFLVSSCLIIASASLLLGNRNWIQIVLLAVLAPMCLYLIATRGMLVSLPELNFIELFYARSISWIQTWVSP